MRSGSWDFAAPRPPLHDKGWTGALRRTCAQAYRDEAELIDWIEQCALARKAELLESRDTNLYVVFDGNAVKFGVAANPLARFAGLQSANPRPLLLYAACAAPVALERLLHGILLRWRLRGEWYRAAPPVLAVADMLLAISQMCEDMATAEYQPDGSDTVQFIVDRLESEEMVA